MGNALYTRSDYNENINLYLHTNGVFRSFIINRYITISVLKERIMHMRGLLNPPNLYLYLADGCTELMDNLTLDELDNNSKILLTENGHMPEHLLLDVSAPNFPHFNEISQALDNTNRTLNRQLNQVNAMVIGTLVLYSLVYKCRPYFQPYVNMAFSYVQVALMKKKE